MSIQAIRPSRSIRRTAFLLATALLAAACGGVGASTQEPGTGIHSLSAGGRHTCSLAADGTMSCWGENDGGVLGDGTTITWLSPNPVSMPAGVTFTAVDAGTGSTCALDTDGAAWCWGTSWDDPSTTADDAYVPAAVPMPADTRFTQISTGAGTTCALDMDALAWCWGSNGAGQLGDGTTQDSAVPVRVAMPAGRTFTDVAVGGGRGFACALADDGSAWCWGAWAGDTTFDTSPVPSTAVSAVGVPDGVTFGSIAAGEFHACAIAADGAAWCWGWGEPEPIGLATDTVPDGVNAHRVESTVSFTTIAVNEGTACAISREGAPWCWGYPGYIFGGGNPTSTPIEIPLPAGLVLTTVTMGQTHACGRATDGTVWCWGYNGGGELGDGTTVSREGVVGAVLTGSDPIPAPGYFEPIISPWTGEPPIWPLTFDETEAVIGARISGQPSASLGLPPQCLSYTGEGYGGTDEECVYGPLAALGAGEAAIDLLRTYNISVFAVEGTGSVKVAWVFDWDDWGSNGYNADYVFTPQGLIGDWGNWLEMHQAERAAYADDTFARINAALPELYGVYFGQYGGETDYYGVPIANGSGWTVPLTLRLAGCHACITPFAGRFAIDFSAEGSPEAVRYLDFCAYPVPSGYADRPEATALAASLPACEPNTPHDGSVSPGW